MDIKLVLTDIDGVWTDGGMYYDTSGNEWKKFNTSDSTGIILLRQAGIQTGIITGEQTEIVATRARKLNISIVEMGAKNKLAVAKRLSQDLNIPFEHMAYVGDDVNDIELLQKVAFSATPANAPEYVRKYAQLVLKKSGGEGAFREFAEQLLTEMGLFEKALEDWLKQIRSS